MASLFPSQNVKCLIQQAKQGDKSSLDEICSGLLPVVERLCQTRFPECLKAKAGTSDLVQESMLGAAENLGSLQGSNEADLVAWVQVIVENKAQDLRRRFLLAEKRDVSRELSLSQERSSALGILLQDSSKTPLEKLISREQARRLEQLVSELPNHYQEIVNLRHRDGLTFPDIAAMLGKTEPAVKNIYVRAIQSIEREINGG